MKNLKELKKLLVAYLDNGNDEMVAKIRKRILEIEKTNNDLEEEIETLEGGDDE